MGNPLGGLSDFVERLGDVGNYIFRAFNDHGKTLTKRLQRCLIPWLAKKFNWITCLGRHSLQARDSFFSKGAQS
jgi:hypothetical protein